ncbi:enoyl-CoA hydratase-related protein [Sagittula sp. SSi028]|uniref:enoyl-CoA hydratase-related protein n=1 Tax=Sagittula sp. SSi028 TaxID=3400636 RepID=UPI003AF5CFDC
MIYDTITYDLSDDIATITLNRSEVMNALNTQMRAEITDAFGRGGREARVVVMTGKGGAFCSGQDLGDRETVASLDLERILRDEYVPMLKSIYDCPVPTICAVNGAAAGAGANLALSADVVIATQSAFFMQAFTKIGLIPDAGGTWFLPRQIGMAKAMGAALFADRITAEQADAMGMIWEHVPDDQFEAHVARRAAHLAKGPTAAYAKVKEAMFASLGNDLEAQLAVEARLQGECGKTRDFKEGVVAFMEKRAPVYEGR